MLTIFMQNGQLVVGDVEQFGAAVRDGAIRGVKTAADLLAADIASHTPRKTGRARQSVVTRLTQGGKVAKVTYSFKKKDAYYMRFILLGAKPHVIQNRQRTERGKRQVQRRTLKKLLAGGASYERAYYEATIAAGQRRRKALSFTAGGEQMFRGAVLHPGVQAQPVISQQFAAAHGKIAEALRSSVEKSARSAMEQAARRKATIGRLSGDEWIRANELGLT